MGAINFTSVKLVKGGTIQGNDKGTGTLTTSDVVYDFGAANDLWGLTLSSGDINNSNFGFVVSFTGSGYIFGNDTSFYLKATNFSFSIPSGATIDGIIVEVEARRNSAMEDYAAVDHMKVTVHYTESVGFTRKIKISGTFQDKPIKTKVSGTFEDKPIKIKVGGTFQDA